MLHVLENFGEVPQISERERERAESNKTNRKKRVRDKCIGNYHNRAVELLITHGIIRALTATMIDPIFGGMPEPNCGDSIDFTTTRPLHQIMMRP